MHACVCVSVHVCVCFVCVCVCMCDMNIYMWSVLDTVYIFEKVSCCVRLTNGDAKTFWQSDGAARSHWIR